MSQNNPTIVSASLDDKELRQSVANLVAYVKQGLHTMTDDTTKAVESMQKTLNKLGNVKVDSKGSADGGASRRAKAQNEETDAIDKNVAARDRQIKKNQEAATSYDQMAAAIQKASRMPSEMRPEKPETRARDSFLAFQQGFASQAKQLERQIREAETALNKAVENRVGALNAKLAEARTKLRELEEHLKYAIGHQKTHTSFNPDLTRTQQAIDYTKKRIDELNRQIAEAPSLLGKQAQEINTLRSEHERIANIMREEAQVQQQQAQATQQQITEEQRRTEEIRKQAQAIRESQQWKENKTYQWTDNGVTYRVTESKKLGTLEEQLLQIHRQQTAELHRQQTEEQGKEQVARRYAATLKEQVALARQFFTETGKDKMFLGNFYGSDITRNPVAQYIYQENDARAQGLSIEQQIEQILRQHEETVGRIIQQRQSANKKNEKGIADNTFKKSLASTLGISTEDVNSTGTSIKSITNYANQLKQAWDRLSSSGRNSPFGKELKEEMLMTERQLKRLRAEATRPISLNFIKGQSEKTIDDITYKIQQLQSYKRGLNLTDPKQVAELQQVDAEINRLQKDLNKYMGTTKQATEINHALSRSWNYMKNRLAFYFTVGASTQFIKNLIDIRSQYELNERALGILIGSAERGTQIFNELSQMALVSPYTLIELSSAAKQLTAYDVAARDVVDTTRRLADMASAVGVPMERLTYALGQIKAYGYLNSRDNRMFANAGIPLVKQLADYYTELEGRMVSTADVYDRIKKKAVDYNTVMQVIYRMTDEGGKFFDFQAKMADTLKVRLANFTLAWNNMLNDVGKNWQGFMSGGLEFVTVLMRNWESISNNVYGLAIGFGVARAAMMLMVKLGYAQTIPWLKGTAKQMGSLANKTTAFGNALKGVLSNPLTWWTLLAVAVASAGMAIYQAQQNVKQFNRALSEAAKDNYNNIKEYLDGAQQIRDSLGKVVTDSKGRQIRNADNTVATTPATIANEEANKAWEAMREQIELSTAASESYIGSLMQINDVSQRLRVGFALLDDIQKVNAALKEMGDKALEIPQDYSAWWNLWTLPDGLAQNVRDYTDAVNHNTNAWEDWGKSALRNLLPVGGQFLNLIDYTETESAKLVKLTKDAKVFAESINRFLIAQGQGSNPAGILEGYSAAIKKYATENNLSPQDTFELEVALEKEKAEKMRAALEARLADEKAAKDAARDEEAKADIQSRIDVLEKQKQLYAENLDASRPYWNDFTKYMKERHMSEIQQMFKGMDEEQIRSINWQEGKWNEAVRRWAQEYARSHNMTYDQVFEHLRDWVANANLWTITIGLDFSVNQKSLAETLKSLDQELEQNLSDQERLGKVSSLSVNYTQAQKDIQDKKKREKELRDQDAISKKEEQANAKAAKAANAAAKKEAAAARKAQREAESELQKAFKDELQLIDKVRSQYKKLTDAGVSRGEALTIVTRQFGNSIEHINKVLGKNGLPLFDINSFTGTENPRALLKLLNSQLQAAKVAKNVKPVEIKDLELKIGEIEVEAKAYDTKKVLDGLKSSFDNLEKEYELSLELDANPEFGDMFTGIFNIPTDDLPKTFKEFYERANAEAEKALKEIGVDTDYNIFDILGTRITGEGGYAEKIGRSEESLKSLIDIQEKVRKRFKDIVIATEKDLDDYIKKYGDYSDKIAEIEAGRLEKLKRLKDRYELGEIDTPEYRAQLAAIEQGAAREKGAAKWDEFKNSGLYITMFENLEHVSTATLNTMLAKLQELRTEMGSLSPEQLKQVVTQYSKIEEELISRNPFGTLKDSFMGFIQALKSRREVDKELSESHDAYYHELSILTAAKEKLKRQEASGDKKGVEQTKRFIEAQEKATGLTKKRYERAIQASEDLTDKEKKFAKSMNEVSQKLQSTADIIGTIGSIAEALGVDEGTVEIINDIQQSVSGVATVAQGIGKIASGDYIGGAASVLSGAFSAVSSWFDNGNKKIDRQIKDSEMQVKRLENAYKNLEFTVEQAYGTMAVGARQAAIANKELQLAELKRQLALEKSRDSKHRDEQRILDLRGQIIDLKNEIIKSYQEIATDLLGISSVADAAESMMDAYIAALRSGEDAMESFEGSVKDMVANIIKKLFVTKVIAPELERLVDDMNERITNRSSKEAKAYEEAVRKQSEFEEQYDDDKLDFMYRWGRRFGGYQEFATVDDFIKAVRAPYEDAVKQAKRELDKVTTPTLEDIDLVAQEAYAMIPALENMNDDIVAMLQRYDLIESDLDKTGNLSALQQGIQSISEDTAGAIEAYLNGMSQQAYLRNDILTQIRDTVQGFEMDAQLGTISQILLQLQSSYQVQMSIQNILQGALTPSGRGFSVQLIS